VRSITVITTNKRTRYSNAINLFTYRQIRKDLFIGFEIKDVGDFSISTATVAKALFDFLYLRKNIIKNKSVFDSLRLNLSLLSAGDIREFKKYIKKEGSVKMRLIESFM